MWDLPHGAGDIESGLQVRAAGTFRKLSGMGMAFQCFDRSTIGRALFLFKAPDMSAIDLSPHGILVTNTLRNASPPKLYEEALKQGGLITDKGALACDSGEKTGRCPGDKRIVDESLVSGDVWWGDVNIRLNPVSFSINRHHAIGYLNTLPKLYVTDGYAGWDDRYRIKIRVICESAYHALFMHNMLIRPSQKELEHFGEPDFTIINAGRFAANPFIPGVTSDTSVALSFESRELVILGTEYAGEMKKGVFTLMHYLMPKSGVLSMHCSANEGKQGDVSLFFGLSGTGKTTLSADADRKLIGDDEHCWSDHGVFNIEGGCYAKAVNLSEEKEPEIYDAIHFGTVLENVVVDEQTRVVDYSDTSITPNTRASYPIEHMKGAKLPCIAGHPKNIIFLTCDAFGVLPPVSVLTPEQTMYHFISGYTAKVAGTEQGVKEPMATFSACYGEAFLVWHPAKYAELLAEKMQHNDAKAWLVNTGWIGGAYGVGERISLQHTRQIIDRIHDGSLAKKPVVADTIFGLSRPQSCAGIPAEILDPQNGWESAAAYKKSAEQLASLFNENFQTYAAGASEAVRQAGPRVSAKRAKRKRSTVG